MMEGEIDIKEKETKIKRPKIKICGLTSASDAKLLNANEVEYAGVVMFYEKSKRNCLVEKAKIIIKSLDSHIIRVAVCVDPTIEQVKIIEEIGFDVLQVHGNLSKEVLNFTQIKVLKAFNMGEAQQIKELECILEDEKILGCVLDSAVSGHGKTFDWTLIKDFDRKDKVLMLAGGINADNVLSAIDYIHPDIVDVSTGVEDENGQGKDAEKIKIFVRKVRDNE